MANPKIELSTGKVIEAHEKWTVGLEYKALRLSRARASADPTGALVDMADMLITQLAYTFVSVVSVDGKAAADLAKGVDGDEILLSFRETFTDGEWQQLEAALAEVHPRVVTDPNPGKYRIIFT
jgi:hypothetical protein